MASADTRTQIDYANLFPVEYETLAGVAAEAVIDFSALTSMAKAEVALVKLTEAKVLQCDDATRASIGQKLALFLGRPYQKPRSQ